MSSLLLVFSQYARPELVSTRFEHPLFGEELCAVRGKFPGAEINGGTFQWTPAVVALCELLLRTKAASLGCSVEAELRGNRGSRAASLEQAINKPPRWLIEMFGWDTEGKSLAPRLFLRSNPGMKRTEPVVLRVNERQLAANTVKIIVGEREVKDPKSMEKLICKLSRAKPSITASRKGSRLNLSRSHFENKHELMPITSAAQTFPALFRSSSVQKMLARSYRAEIFAMLKQTNIFSRVSLKQQIIAISQNPSFQALVSNQPRVFETLSPTLSSSLMLGYGPNGVQALQDGPPIKVVLTGVQAGTLAILRYMQCIKEIPLVIDYYYPYGVELVDRVLNEDFAQMPDACFAGIGPAARLLNARHNEYELRMLAPRLTHRVISPHHSRQQAISEGDYYFVTDDPTTASFYFDELERRSVLNRRHLTLYHREPDEVLDTFSKVDGPARSILWFPHYQLHAYFLKAQLLDSIQPGINDQAVMMFLHKEFQQNRRALLFESAFRNSWLEILEDPEALDCATRLLVEEPSYLRFVARITGLSRESQDLICDGETVN